MFKKSPSLRAKLVLVLVAVNALGLILLAIGSSYVVVDNFKKLEVRAVSTNAARLAESVHERMSYAASKIPDWGKWDDTFKYAKDSNKSY